MLDVALLGPLVATTKKNDEHARLLAEIHALAWSEINSQLENAAADNFTVAEVAEPESSNPRSDHGTTANIAESTQPVREWRPAIGRCVEQNFNRSRRHRHL